MKDLIKNKLEVLGIKYTDKDKYYTNCPKCGHEHSTALLVQTDNDKVYYQCMREGKCDWNKRQSFNIKSTKVEAPKQEPIPEGQKPRVPDGAILYPYRDKDGILQFYIVRVNNPDGKKIFPCVMENGEFKFEGYKGKSLYGAELLKDSQKPVIVVEGEKAAEAGRKIFSKAIVVTWPGGTNGVNRGDWELLRDREVILWPDNDDVGKEAMNKIAQLIPSSNITIVTVDQLPPKADLADNISKEVIQNLYSERQSIQSLQSIKGQITGKDFLTNISKISTGLGLGWPRMDKVLRLPQSGLVVIGGRTGHGKTTLMLNILANMLTKTDKKLIYYTYEIPATRVLLKLLMALEGVEKDPTPYRNEEIYRTELIANRLKSWPAIEGHLDSGRLVITDNSTSIEDLVNELDHANLEGSIVFVDYIQLIPSGRSNENRYLTVKHFADSLRSIANKRNMVIITGSQLTDGETPYQDSVREGKDIANASELVVKVWNKIVARSQELFKKRKLKNGEEEVEEYYDTVGGNFIIDVVKNRNGEPGKRFGFNLLFGCKLTEVVNYITERERF